MAAAPAPSLLESLPVEIIDKILERLCDKFDPTSLQPTWDLPIGQYWYEDPITGTTEERGLLSACLASRSLSSIAMKVLYRYRSIGKRGSREAVLFARTLAARRDLAQAVRVLFVTIQARHDALMIPGDPSGERCVLVNILNALPALRELVVHFSNDEMWDPLPISNFAPGSLGSVRKLFIRQYDGSSYSGRRVRFQVFEELLNATAPNLTHLYLKRCALIRQGHPYLMHGIAELPHLATLELHSCHFDDMVDLRGFVTHMSRHGALESLSINRRPSYHPELTPTLLADALEATRLRGLQSLDLRPDMDRWWADGYEADEELPRREVHHRIEPLLRTCTTLTSLILEYSLIFPVHRAETHPLELWPGDSHDRLPDYIRQRQEMRPLGLFHALPSSIHELTITNVIEIPELIIQFADSLGSDSGVRHLGKLRVINLAFLIGMLRPSREQATASLPTNEACVNWLIDDKGGARQLVGRLAAVGITLNLFSCTARKPWQIRPGCAIWRDCEGCWSPVA